MTWASAHHVFMLCYATANAFAACQALGLLEPGTTMWGFQLDIIRRRYFARAKVVCIDHVTTSAACSREGCRETNVLPLPHNVNGIHVQGVHRALANKVLWPAA